jgi:hypothetical protein
MSVLHFSRCVFGICAAVAILAGCRGTGASPAPPAPLQQSDAQSPFGELFAGAIDAAKSGAARGGWVNVQPDRGRSWMSPAAGAKALLYVSNYTENSVSVYSYPQGKLVGTLTGFAAPDGICADKKGNVWIVNNAATPSGEDAVEYKHGGKNPIATLKIGSGYAVSCSVDPITGNLATTVLETYGSGQGYVAIFTHAKGTPTYYIDSQMFAVYFCGYDNKGNLYVDGTAGGPSGPFRFAELPKGKKKFKDITLKGGSIVFPGTIRWDGKRVAVGDQVYQGGYPETSAIYQTTGAGGKIVGVTELSGSSDVEGFWIDGKTVVGTDECQNGCTTYSSVGFYKYPVGGKRTKTIKKVGEWPIGVAVSR